MPPIGKQPTERARYTPQPPGTDNFAPGGFTGGQTPEQTSAAADPTSGVRPPWSKGAGTPTPKPYDGWTDTAHVGANTIGSNAGATTYKGK